MECLIIKPFFDKTNNNKLIKPGEIYKCDKDRFNFLLSNGVAKKLDDGDGMIEGENPDATVSTPKVAKKKEKKNGNNK